MTLIVLMWTDMALLEKRRKRRKLHHGFKHQSMAAQSKDLKAEEDPTAFRALRRVRRSIASSSDRRPIPRDHTDYPLRAGAHAPRALHVHPRAHHLVAVSLPPPQHPYAAVAR